MKGIVLAGGAGTRLYPLTLSVSKQLLPVYDKPMIYYPLSTLMLAGIRDVLIISTPQDTPKIEELLGNGENLGMRLSYTVQEKPEGLTQAFIIGKDFIGDDACGMVLGDNIFYGNGLGRKLQAAANRAKGGEAVIFGYYVEDPQRFGIMEFQQDSAYQEDELKVLSLEEKPTNPKSNYAVVGLYFYPAGVSEMAEKVVPSQRGELEITSLNEMYLEEGRISAEILSRGYTWIDAGTIDSLCNATNFVCMMEQYQGMSISALEEIAYRYGWISKESLIKSAERYGKSQYGEHLMAVAEGKVI